MVPLPPHTRAPSWEGIAAAFVSLGPGRPSKVQQLLKQMRLKRVFPAFAIKQSGFSSVSLWKLLLKNSNIISRHFVKTPQPINKRLVANRDSNLCLNFKKTSQMSIIRHFYLAPVSGFSVAAAEQAVLGQSSQCCASCLALECAWHSLSSALDWVDESKAIAAIHISMPELNLLRFLQCN